MPEIADRLSIPVALDGDVLIDPVSAEPRKRYTAPCCSQPVIVRKSHNLPNSPRSHFSHLPDADCAAGESREHLLAKALLALYYPRARVRLVRWCLLGHRVPVVVPIGSCEREVRVGTGDSLVVADVLVRAQDGGPLMALEVFQSHAVDAVKRAKFTALQLRWAEISAADVLAADFATPVTLEARQSHATTEPCPTCVAEDAAQRAAAEKARQKRLEFAAEIVKGIAWTLTHGSDLRIKGQRCRSGHVTDRVIEAATWTAEPLSGERDGTGVVLTAKGGASTAEIIFDAFDNRQPLTLYGKPGFVLDLLSAGQLSFHQETGQTIEANWPCAVCAERLAQSSAEAAAWEARQQAARDEAARRTQAVLEELLAREAVEAESDRREKAAREALFAENLRALSALKPARVDTAKVHRDQSWCSGKRHRCIAGPVLVQAAWATAGLAPPEPGAVAARFESCSCACHQ